MKYLCKIFQLIFISGALYSQPLPVQLIAPPPFQFRTEDLWNLVISNNSGQSFRIYLHGKATENTKGLIADATTSVFNLPVGVKRVHSGDVGKVTINESNKTYEDVISRMSSLPSGSYEICVEVIDASTNLVIGETCIDHDVLNLSQVALVYPGDKQQLEQVNCYPIFSWLPPVPTARGQSVTYKLKIAEIFAMQTVYDAMQSNPLYYSNENIRAASYQYPVAARTFREGMKYAWQVAAYVNGVLLSESEINEFNFGEIKPVSKKKELEWMNRYWEANYEASNFGKMGGSFLQSKKKTFLFSFNSTLYSESANRFGTGSDKEPRYGYIELTPSLSIYGLPLSTSILLSSENSAARQNINTVGMNLDISTIRDFITERVRSEKDKMLEERKKELSGLSEKQKEKLESDAKSKVMSKINPVLKFISYFQTLGIGTTYPAYTPLTMQGVPVTGLNAEFNPGWFYIAIAGQKNQKPIDNVSYRRDLYSGRIGYGQKDKSHFYFTGLYVNDKPSSIKADSTNQVLTPNSNYLFGIEAKLNLLKDKLTFEAEAVGSMLTRDNRDDDLENKSIPAFVKNLFHPKISSQVDYSYALKSVFNNQKSNTKVTAGVKMLGPGFITLGNPTLRGDKLEAEGRIDQKFLNKQISVTASFKWFRDNLIKSKTYTTSTVIPNLTVNLNFKGYPYVMLAYLPNFMNNNASDPAYKFNYKNHLALINTGNNLRLGKMNLSSNLSYMFNRATSLDTASGYSSHSFTLSEVLSFDIPLSFSVSFGAIHSDYVNDYSRIFSFDMSAVYTLEDIWTNSIGFSTGVEKDKNRKRTAYLTSTVNIVKNVSVELRAEKNLYTDWNTGLNNYDEFLLRGVVSINY
jgi:hypothetical protein